MLNNDALRRKASQIKYFFTDIDGTLTDGCTYYTESGEAMKKFSHIDGTGFNLLKNAGFIPGMITGENNEIILRRAEKLKLLHCFTGINNKLKLLTQFAIEHQITLAQVAYLGDDLNDLELIKHCGLSFATANAHALIKKEADICCKNPGGTGAFREAVEHLFLLRNIDILATFNKSIL